MNLGNMLGGMLQGMLGGQGAQPGAAQANPIAAVIAALLTPQQGPAAQAFGEGGLEDLLDRFRGAGHAEAVESWVGTGPNKEIAPSALESVFGQGQLAAMAQQAGLPQQDLLAGLARMLPEVINGLTPQGQLPTQGAGLEQLLGGVLGQVLGGRR